LTSPSLFCIENLGVEPIYLPIALEMASTATPMQRAANGYPTNLHPAIKRLVNSFPPAFLHNPITGEVFKSLSKAEQRLKTFTLVTGFDFVRSGGGVTARHTEEKESAPKRVDCLFIKRLNYREGKKERKREFHFVVCVVEIVGYDKTRCCLHWEIQS